MATPFADPRTGQLYFRRAVPEGLRTAFDGKAVVKISLRTKDAAEAKVGFAQENAAFEAKLADARRRMAEGTLVPTPAALVRRGCNGPAANDGLTDPQRFLMTLMELDNAAGARTTCAAIDVYPPWVCGPISNTDWREVLADRQTFEWVVSFGYHGDVEAVGSNWIRKRWFEPEQAWRRCLKDPVLRLREFDSGAERFSDEELGKALLAVVDEKRTGDEEVNRARLAPQRRRPAQSRLRPKFRLRELFREWKKTERPSPAIRAGI